jgi:hypothetical protein
MIMDTDEQYSYLLLNDVMRPDFRRSVILRALEYRTKASRAKRLSSNTIFRQNLKNVRGFSKDPLLAPNSLLIQPAIKSFSRDTDFIWAILSLWLEAEAGLREQVEKFLYKEKLFSIDPELPHNGFTRCWTTGQMLSMTKKYLLEYPQAVEDDVELMLCCLTSQAPIIGDDEPDRIEKQDQAPTPVVDDEPEIPESTSLADLPIVTPEIPFLDKMDQKKSEELFEYQPTSSILSMIDDDQPKPDKLTDIETPKAEKIVSADYEKEYLSLVAALDLARELLAAGNFEKLHIWAKDYQQQVTKKTSIFEYLQENLRNESQILEDVVKRDLSKGDAEPFFSEIRQLRNVLTLNLPQQIAAFKTIGILKSKVEDYRVRRKKDIEKVEAEVSEFIRIVAKAKLWKVNDEKLIIPSKYQTREIVSIRELEQLAKQIEESRFDIEEEVEGMRSKMIAALLDKCREILAQIESKDAVLEGETFTKELAKIQSALMNDISDEELFRLPEHIESIYKRLAQPGLSEEIINAAMAYMNDPNQYYLDYVLDILWGHGHEAVAFILLTSALRGVRWNSGASLPEGGLAGYLRGLIDISPADELVSASLDLLSDGLLTSVVSFDQPKEVMSMIILYSSLLLARPGVLSKEALWDFKRDNIDYIAPLWQQVADGLMQDNCPLVIRKEKLEFRELKTLQSQLNEEFRREGGKYVHIVGTGSKSLLNMAQKTLLPELENLWRNIDECHPSQTGWVGLKENLESIHVDEYFANHCRENGLTADVNPHFRKEFEERIAEIIDLIKRYAQVREDAFEVEVQRPITWEDLLGELEAYQKVMGDSIIQLAEAAVGEAMQENFTPQETSSSMESLNRRLCRALFTSKNLYYSLPYALDYLGRESLNTETGWSGFFSSIIESLAKPINLEQLAQFYISSNLPHIAEYIAEANNWPEEIEQAKSLQDRLRVELEDKKSTLNKLGGELSDREMIWLEEKRYSLILRSLIDQIESHHQQQKQRAKEQQAELNNLYSAVSELEPKLAEKTELPAVTRDEIFHALTAIRQVYYRSETSRLNNARNVLAEIRHLLEYPGAGAEGLYRALENLNKPIELSEDKQAYKRSQYIRDSSLNAIQDNLLNGDWEQLNLAEDALSEKQREDRAELLGLWHRISGLSEEPSDLTQENLDDLKRFATIFASTTKMYFGEIVRGANITHVWAARPIPHFETKFIRPGTAALSNSIVLIYLTQPEISRRQLRELERIIQDEQWLKNGFFLVFVTPIAVDTVRDWMIRNYSQSPCVVLDKELLLDIVLSTDNPTATGRFRRVLGRVAGPEKFDVFKFENLVDPDREIFVGRADQIRALVNSDQSHAIYGGRRIGKSSLLNALDRELRSRGVKTAYSSLEGPSVREHNGIAIGSEILQKLRIGQSCSSLSDFKLQMTSYFLENPDISVVIFLDEVDRYIVARKQDKQPHDLIHICRSLYQEHHGRCRFIMAGFIEMWRQLSGKGGISGQEDPWFNFLQHTGPLEGLPSNDAQAIVRLGFQEILGISFNSDAIPRRIVEATTGHPAFVQKFCERLHRLLFSQRSDEIREEDVHSVFDDRTGENYLSFVNYTLKQNLNPLPRLVVYLMASEKRETFSVDDVRSVAQSYAEKLGGIEETMWVNSMDELQITSVIKKTQIPYVYQFSVPSYQKILRNFELANQDVVYKLIGEITNEAME